QDKWRKNFYRGSPLTKHLAEFSNPGARPDSPSPGNYMKDIEDHRALALFVGYEYPAIEIVLSAWLEDRALKEDEEDTIKKIKAKQQEEWTKRAKDWEKRKDDWINDQLIDAAREKYGFGRDWKVFDFQRFRDYLHVGFRSKAGLEETRDYRWPPP